MSLIFLHLSHFAGPWHHLPNFVKKLFFFFWGVCLLGGDVFLRVCGFPQRTFPLPVLTGSKPLLCFTFSLSDKPQESHRSTWMCEWFWEFCVLIFGVSGSDYAIDWMIQREMLFNFWSLSDLFGENSWLALLDLVHFVILKLGFSCRSSRIGGK